MKISMQAISVGVVVVGVLGCGSGSGTGGSCGQVPPCGGAVVGSWKLASSCILDSAQLGAEAMDVCPTQTIAVKKVGGTAAVTYSADHTYASTGNIAIDFALVVPTTCFTTGNSCADLNAAYAQAMRTDPRLTAAACSTSSSTCACEVSVVLDVGEAGTYSTSLTTLSTVTTGQTAASSDQYCVQGSELHDISVDMTMPLGPMGMAKIAGDLVFTKD